MKIYIQNVAKIKPFLSLISSFFVPPKVSLSILICVLTLLLTIQNSFAQNNSAIVEFASQDKGFLIPRMSTQSRIDIDEPVEGLVVYDMSLHNFYFFNGESWQVTGSSATISSTTSSNILGTTDYNPLIFITNNVERIRINEDGQLLMDSEIITRNLEVKENVHLNSEIGITTIDGFTVINGESEIGGPLKNASTFTGKVNINDDVKVEGKTNLRSDVDVEGVTSINNFITISKTTNTKDLVVKNDVLLNSENGRTTVLGPADFGGPLLSPSTFTGPVLIDNKLNVNDIELKNSLVVHGRLTVGKSTKLGDSLTVDGVVLLKDKLDVNGPVVMDQTLDAAGNTTIGGTLDVEGASHIKDKLTVDLATDLKNSLTVNNGTVLKSTLNVAGNTSIGGSASVGENLSASGTFYAGNNATLSRSLSVGTTANIGSNLTVGGTSTLNNALSVTQGGANINGQFNVAANVSEVNTNTGGFIASFHNTNQGKADGINIRLGKKKSAYILPDIPTALTQTQVEQIKNLLRCDPLGKLNILKDIMIDVGVESVKMVAGIAVSIGNVILTYFNNALGLPVNLPEISGDFSWVPIVDFGKITFLSARTLVPKIPEVTLESLNLGLKDYDIESLSFWGVPNLCLDDPSPFTPLNNENEFIRFSDSDNQQMGAIKAQSVTDWSQNYLNPFFLKQLYGAFYSAVKDPKHGEYHFRSLTDAAVMSYRRIGVEYTSSAGDYAEWLEKFDPKELINPGDIVSIKGGKITKDLSNAEQIMVVSHHPIVLGNTPPEGKSHLGQNVAFMGQIPANIMGPVHSGDYIVANLETPGYGVAKNERDMTIEDFKLAVGRSWENNENEGPIMVNTVVGIHNGDYLKILKNFQEKFKQTEKRFESLESKIEALSTQ